RAGFLERLSIVRGPARKLPSQGGEGVIVDVIEVIDLLVRQLRHELDGDGACRRRLGQQQLCAGKNFGTERIKPNRGAVWPLPWDLGALCPTSIDDMRQVRFAVKDLVGFVDQQCRTQAIDEPIHVWASQLSCGMSPWR